MPTRIILSILICVIAIMFSPPSPAGTINYVYDDLYRLKEAQYPDGTILEYIYDQLGNRMQQKITSIDLIANSVSGPSSANILQPITVTSTVMNQGTHSSGPFSVSIYLSSDATITTGDTLLGSSSVDYLAAVGQTNLNTSVTIPVGMAAGTYYIGAIVDDNNAITESIETNNAFAGSTININRNIIRIASTPPVYYPTIQEAYNVAAEGNVIQCMGINITGNLNANRNVSVLLEGGYNYDFFTTISNTLLNGSMDISSGGITINNFELQY